MENIKNYSNIAFCKYIVFFLGLIFNFLQNKEFSKNINTLKLKVTKLIPKGFYNLNFASLFSELSINSSFALASKENKLEFAFTDTSFAGAITQSTKMDIVNYTINKSETGILSSKLFSNHKPSSLSSSNNSLTSARQILQKEIINVGTEKSMNKNKLKKLEQLKPLLFQYLIEKNNQNGIGLDLKNKKLLNYNFNNGISNSKNHFFNSCLALASQSNNTSSSNMQLVEKKNWFLSEDLIKLLSAFFKSIYCLISKPKFINTPDKIIIEILYYITIPQNNIFKWYNFIYNTKKVIALNYINTSNNEPAVNKNQNLLKLNTEINKMNKKKLKVQKWNRLLKIILKKNFLIKKTLFNLNKTNITNLYLNKFIILFKLLSSYFKKPIEFNLIRLHKSDYDSNILAQLFFLILKRKNIKAAISKLYFKNKIGMILEGKDINLVGAKKKNLAKFIPAYISGLYVQIGGRLLKERIVPKRTTKKFEKGAIATGKINFLDSARITKKNKKGAFTIKIAYAQNFRFVATAG